MLTNPIITDDTNGTYVEVPVGFYAILETVPKFVRSFVKDAVGREGKVNIISVRDDAHIIVVEKEMHEIMTGPITFCFLLRGSPSNAQIV